jgi:hypothetical protein
MGTCQRQELLMSRKFETSRCTAVLFGTSLREYEILRVYVSRRAVNDFDVKYVRQQTIFLLVNTPFRTCRAFV